MRPVRTTVSRALLVGALTVMVMSAISCQPAGTPGLTESEANRITAAYLEARNTANLALLDQVFDAAVIVHDCGAPGDIQGLDSLKSFYEGSHAGFPDFRIAFDDVLVSGDNIIIRWTIRGTHTGLLRGLPPTGRSVRFSGLAVGRVAHGRIVEEWVYYNVLDVLQPLGFSLVPPSAPAGN